MFEFRSALRLRHYQVSTPLWTATPLRIAVLSDLHVIRPWSSLDRLRKACNLIQKQAADLILLPGDFITSPRMPGLRALVEEIAPILATLKAPLGVFASLGNHDWRDCPRTRATGFLRSYVAEVLENWGIPVLSNASRQLDTFWLVGFDSGQGEGSVRKPNSRIDRAKAFAEVPAGAPVVLMAHEPDCFAAPDPRVALQVSGHTHAGQMNLLGWRPLTPSRHGSRYAVGAISNGSHRLVVSAGWGFSGVPLRVDAPSEITLIELSGA